MEKHILSLCDKDTRRGEGTPTTSRINPQSSPCAQASERQEVLKWLAANNYPALPVAPAQSAEKYPAKEKDGRVRRDKIGNPVPAFTGKNPSYLDEKGVPRLVNHRQYQSQLPTNRELKTWFANPANGVGTLGGWNNAIWLDLDVKQFSNKEECERAFRAKLEVHPNLANTFIEETHSGGWRIGVRVRDKPAFTNFALDPGGKHVGEALGEGRFTVLAPTIGPSGNSYKSVNRVQLVEVESLESIGIYPTSNKTQQCQTLRNTHPVASYICGSIPLEMLGNETSREILQGACPTDDRSEALATATQEWYGWQNWAQENGIHIIGDTATLAHHAGSLLGLDSDRINRILKTIDSGKCHPAALHRGDEKSCWKKIRRLDKATFEAQCPNHIKDSINSELNGSQKPTGRGFSGGIGSGGGGGRRSNGGSGSSGGDGGDGDGKQPLSELSLRDRILEILNRNQDRSERDEAFIQLAKTTGVTTREIKELATSLESEVDLGESRSDRKTEIENLLRIGNYNLTLRDYLDPSVALPLERVAKWMGTTPAAMLTTLYPVVGSLLKVGTRLELIEATNFYALPVVHTGLVCESGAGKTPAQKTIINPLFVIQADAEIEYKQRLLEYQKELSQWKKNKDSDEPAPEQPVPHEYYTTDATSEAIALIQSQQPGDGFLGWFDELPALFKSQGQYKNGRGADGEKILSGRDGTGFKVNRASGKRLVVEQSAYSITGSLQPLILRQMMGDFTDANGQWARFLWTVMQVQPAPYPDDAIPFDVSGLLKGIYKRLKNLPPVTYRLSSQAKKLYRNWYNELDQLKMAESRQGLRAVYSKMKGDTGVLALLLHCFNGCVAEGSTPAQEVDEATMAAAIKLSKYHIGQVKLIHSEGDAANGDVAAIHAKIIQLSERKGWLKAADVRDIDRQTKKQFSADDIRRHFQELEASGFGQTKGERTKLMWSIHKDIPSGQNSGHLS